MSDTSTPFTPFVLDNAWVIDFPAEGGMLRIGPGLLHVEARIRHHERGEEGWYTAVACDLRITDAIGVVWEATTSFLSWWLIYPVVDLARREAARWLRKAPADWAEALEERPLATGVAATYDDRFYRFVWLDNTGFCWQFKYFGVTFRLAALDASRVLICLDGLFCSWNPVVVEGADGAPLPRRPPGPPLSLEEREQETTRLDEEGEIGDYDHAAPVVYPLEAGRVLFRNTAWLDAEESWQDLPVSRPLLFRRTAETGPAQAAVVHRPGARPLAPGGAGEGPEDGFVPLGGQFGEPLEFLTDAGGRLSVAAGPGRYLVRLDRHPDSAREPVDVVRCRVRVADEAGSLWETVTLFTPEAVFEGLTDLDGGDAPAFDGAFAAEPGTLTGVRALIDDGVWRYAFLGNHLVALPGRQAAAVDITPVGEGFTVRIRGLTGRRRAVDLDRDHITLDPPDRAGEETWGEDAELPPVVFSVPLATLAFRNTTFAVDDGFWHQNAVPIPVVFTRVGTAETGAGVQFVPDAAA